MKKILLFVFSVATLCVSAQYTTPRTGTGANNDNTFRAMNIKYKVITDAAGLDTVKVNLNAFRTYLKINTLTDSVTLNFTPTTNSYYGDEVIITVLNSSGGKCVKWVSTNIVTATSTAGGGGGQLYVSASQYATISFIFDGSKWVERGRMAK